MNVEVDPTAIALEVDPREQRMRGTAFHGNTTFDVPYVSHIEGNLWTGGCADGLVLPPNIAHVVSLYPWESYKITHEVQSYLAVKLYDAGLPPANDLSRIVLWASSCVLDGPTLIHCQAGLNRSALVAALVLRHLDPDLTADAAIALLRERRSPAVLCNREFEGWLRR